MKFYLTTIAFICFITQAASSTVIKGDISEITFDKSGNPFVVEEQIFVPENKSIEIREGCLFLFKEYSGFEIRGNLIVTGTVEDPVVFTSYNDNQYNPNSEKKVESFNWNGITVTKTAKRVIMSNILVGYSVYGIKSGIENITLLHALFFENGQYNFTVNGKLKDVKSMVPFSYGTIAGFGNKQPIGTNIAVLDLTSTSDDFSESEVKTITERLRGELVETGKYNVLERKEMNEILKEQNFQHTGACDDECIVEIGQLLAVKNIVGGTIGKVGKTFSVQLKVVDVATAKITKQVSEDAQCTKEDLLLFHVRNVARKLAGLDKINKPFTSQWYFWAPIIAVVGGGAAAATYLIVTNNDGAQTEQPRLLQVEVPIQ
jgi:hypothetical protein